MTKSFTYLLLSLALSACARQQTVQPQLVGSDRDAHGCIASAGYAWCAQAAQCERPWELAQQKGFALTQKNFAEFCQQSE